MEKFALFVLGAAAAIGLIFFSAFALSTGWSWFVVPLGAPAIGMAHAFGLSSLLGLLRVKHTSDPEEDEQLRVLMFRAYIHIAVCMGFMWTASKLI